MSTQNIFKYRIKLKKNNELKFISHLDWQNLILKIFRRCELKLVLSEGFNKMPKVSYSPALPIFIESECELVNFQTHEPLDDNFSQNFKKHSPNGIELVDLYDISNNSNEPKSLEKYIQWAQYEAQVKNDKKNIYNLEKIRYIIEKCLSSNELFMTKKTKKGIEKTLNYRTSLKSVEVKDDNLLIFTLKAGQDENIPAIRADEFLKSLFLRDDIFKIKRVKFFDTDLKVI